MKRSYVYDYLDRLENCIWSILSPIKLICDKDFRITLGNNKSYKDIHKDKRCFIVGNGPSLKKHGDLSFLKEEIVFTVNQLYRSELFELISPNYHIMVDPLFFNLDPSNPIENDTLLRMKNLSTCNNLTCIFPYSSKEYILKHNIGSNNLFITSRYRMHNGYDREIRMDKELPLVQNVVHAALYCAIYMGFKEIYLIGCDMTGMLTSFIQDDLESNITREHVYQYTNEEKMRMLKVRKDNSNEVMLLAYGLTFSIFRNIYEYCSKRSILLFNSTIGGALDNIPRVSLESLLDEYRRD